MGGSHSVEIPGGGTEGYHVLRVRQPVKITESSYRHVWVARGVYL